MMKLSDFSSVLQLGVGVHLGTALLQSIAEFTSSPLSKRIERLAKLAALRRTRFEKVGGVLADQSLDLENQVHDLHSTLELRKVQFFNEYRRAALINTVAALVLFGLLAWAAVSGDREIKSCLAFFLICISLAPSLLSLSTLGYRWHANTKDVRSSTADIERELLG